MPITLIVNLISPYDLMELLLMASWMLEMNGSRLYQKIYLDN